MKRMLILSAFMAVGITAFPQEGGNMGYVDYVFDESCLESVEPVYASNYVDLSAHRHWFIGVNGGWNAFTGSPNGCGDVFDRSGWQIGANVGKWFSPRFGARIAFEGLKYKNADGIRGNYQTYHLDIMYNISNGWKNRSDEAPRWEVAPYVGAGMAHGSRQCLDGSETGGRTTSFALAYGISARYRISRHLHLTGEVGGFTASRMFDGRVTSLERAYRLGDNLLHATVGLSVSLGGSRWRRAVDYAPVEGRISSLKDAVRNLYGQNGELREQHEMDQNRIAELRKILSLEGLLDKYAYLFEDGDGRNTYSGLESLLSRIRGTGGGTGAVRSDTVSMSPDIPIFFFFQKGKAQLTDDSQLVNLDELARVANAYHLRLKVVGAADAATGNETINTRLGAERAEFIISELEKRGIQTDRIVDQNAGGISEYQIPERNRYSRVSVYFK